MRRDVLGAGDGHDTLAEKGLVRGLVGVALGAALPAPVKGMEFTLCALFTVLPLDALRSRQEIPSLLLAGAGVTVALVLTQGVALFTALLLFVALLYALAAVAVTIGVHLVFGRRTILSVGLGTTVYVILLSAL
ncbi:hypothetical protein ACFZAR_14805 [Streptomyces sp. NPDC008222]|uniref:hypothetical protein n=1 Tax=Streptomyces sp. NPDC008222 TaxID=3364820 RepID=UPI0036EC7276